MEKNYLVLIIKTETLLTQKEDFITYIKQMTYGQGRTTLQSENAAYCVFAILTALIIVKQLIVGGGILLDCH